MPTVDLNPELLLVRLKPQDDELLSSWLVRLAAGNSLKLKTFTRTRFGLGQDFWRHDVDRFASAELTSKIAKATGVSEEQAFATTLAAYEGAPYEQHTTIGPQRWLLPVGKGSAWTLHGQQFCPRCLANDTAPYFRRRWRLSMSFACIEHQAMLLDACQKCGGSVSFYGGDFHHLTLPEQALMTKCWQCGYDLRRQEDAGNVLQPDMIAFQKNLYEVLDQNTSILGPAHPSFPHLFFDGLHLLLRALSSNGHTVRLREFLLTKRGEKSQLTPFRTALIRFDELPILERTSLLGLARDLLQNWPQTFVDACRSAKLSSTYLLDYRKKVRAPYWYTSVVHSELNGTPYRPTEAEKESVRQYLRRRWLPEGVNSVNRWIGCYTIAKKAQR